MKIKFLQDDSHVNYAKLLMGDIDSTNGKNTAMIEHSNSYNSEDAAYDFRVEGTKKELEIIKEFCEKITKAT